MKKLKEKHLLIIIILIIIIFLILFYFVTNNKRNLTFVEKTVKESVLFVEKIIYAPFNYINTKIEEYNETKKLYKQLEKNKVKIESYEKLEATLKEKDREIKELEELLKLKNDLSDYETIEASVIYRSTLEFYNSITIDKGEKDGIVKDSAVITPQGLIGKIVNTTSHTSTVKLLTTVNDDFQISVNIQNGDDLVYGLLSNYQDNKFVINGISDNSDIILYSKVITTGLDNIFPSGILIGNVAKINTDNFDLAKTIYVNPSVDFNNIRYVSVLIRKDLK